MAAEGYLQPFDSIGITPPRGRAGHSVPLPRPLTGASLKPFAPPGAVSGGQLQPPEGTQKLEAQVPYSGAVGLSPAQFYVRRDHTLGGSVSRLDRLRTHQELPYMESFAEVEEEEEDGEPDKQEQISAGDPKAEELSEVDSGRPVSRQSLQSGDLGGSRCGRQMSITLDKFTGDSLLHFSYSAVGGGAGGMLSESALGGSFVRAFTQGLNSSLNVPFVHQNTSLSSPSGDTSALFPTASRNPNKAIITIDAQSSRILVANEMTCELFGYQKDELSGMKVQNLFTEPYRAKQQALVEQNIDSSGATVLISGKVMDAVTAYGVEFPVSVWMKRLAGASPLTPPTGDASRDKPVPRPPRVIVVIEPVERSSAFFTMDQDGKIVSCDPWFAVLFGFSDSPEVIGKSILEFIPSLKLPASLELIDKEISKQAATGRTKDDTVFPLTVKFTDVSQNLSVGDLYSPSCTFDRLEQLPLQNKGGEGTSGKQSLPPGQADDPGSSSSTVRGDHFCINAKVTVYAALSGMVSFLPDGTIYGCNHHFAVMLFGYSQEELLKKDITFLIPEFYNHINYIDDRNMPLPPLDEEELFHDVMEHSFTPDSALELMKNWNLGTKAHHHHSPAHRKSADFQHSPAKKVLNFQDVVDDAHMDIEGVPLSSSEQIKEERGSQAHESQTSSTQQNNVKPDLTTSDTVTGITTDPLAIIDDLAESNSARQRTSISNATRPLSSMSEPCNRTQGYHEVPKRLVPSASTERIMDILRERGLDVGIQSEGERKRPFNESLEEVAEESYSSGHEEEMTSPYHRRGRFSSSTPAEKSEECLQQACNYRGSQAEGIVSPHLFSVGSSPMHGSNQELQRRLSLNSLVSLPEGTYLGEAKHKDGSLMSIVFQLKPISLADGKNLFCMWISRDLDCERARIADLSMSMSRPPPDPYRSNQIISPDVAVPGVGVGVAIGGVSAPARRISDPVSSRSLHAQFPQSSFNSGVLQEEILAMEGEYSISYDTLTSIGKGAFGFVRLAQRKEDGLLVVVKFLRKSSVLKDCWVDDEEMGRVPREIQLLARLSHPNIVQLLEAYENEHFFQMVMEKHGDGLDLFEFIERNPRLDEPLISYMFRQIVAGLSYLHERNILHRDVKDENIIVDRQFTLKLIDFGSAAYMAPGKKFNTFCGTLEYCSPEVLLGNSYSGPELEMWALGVTLYTLVFGENPFFDVEETISGHLQPPFLTSPALMKVVFWLLHPDPSSRATLKDLRKDKWTNQPVDITHYSFESVLGYASGGSHGHIQAVIPAAVPAASSKISHLIKSNSETDAGHLERALKEQLQFGEGKNEDKKV